jgi:yecA family protein
MIDNKLLHNLTLELDKCVPENEHLNHDGLSGFFYALAITPAIIEPSDWMAELFYGERPILTNKQSKDLKKAVAAVVKSSNKALLKNELKFPYDFSALDDATLDKVWHWCAGFLQGLYLRLAFWKSGIIAKETQQASDVVSNSVDIIFALVEGNVSVLKNLDQLKAQLQLAGKEPTDELILATLLQTLPEAYECIRLFAAQMSERLLARQAESA